MLDYGTFAGKQKGNALTRGDSSSDTRTGISHADVMAALANSGSLRGGTTSRNRKGNQAMSHYSGGLAGKGGLFSDTQSLASDKGGAAHSGMKGFLTGGGEISGSSGSSSAGKGNTGSLGK
ncbi:uncharacterized protein LOC121864850 [Homarus americanus]|uniref:uncharacterized protein LOC121864850 n=1 Tax=Homarus americanus TaxID=6706 RepID=UPI001C46A0A1|nr:uncharacterized protein LOC121864850 [Homarus americanus]